jgi:predicted RNase H-like HicB family nuclease
MAKYVYPAVFVKEDEGGYSVFFPDIESCYTCGDNMAHAIEMAEDVLCLMLCDMEDDGKEIPPPSDCKKIQTDENSLVSLVRCDTIEYRKFYDKKAVKKTLTIPSWINKMAERNDINFSGVLQEALMQKLKITD